MQELSGESLNIVEENIKKLKEIFPEVFEEGKIDFEKLENELGKFIDKESERYNFTWSGKQNAKKIAQTPSTGTLRPCPEESKNWESTQNLYIEGDNLEVLKLLQKSYHKKVKMIYIDPPYNTGKEFIYPDNHRDNLDTYLQYTGQVDNEGKKFSTNTETSGRYHTNWLNMMYPRLKLARNLLKDDGVIFISIDDHEVANLRKICDEIFGEDNFVANVVWQKKYAATNDAKGFSTMHDYILVYQKSKAFNRYLLPRTEKQNKPYKYDDQDGKGLWRSDNLLVKSFSDSGVYPIVNPNTGVEYLPPQGSSWRASKETMDIWLAENRIYWGKDGQGAPQLKRYLNEVQNGRVPSTWWTFEEVGHNDAANKEVAALFKSKTPFDTPKPSTLIKQMLQVSTSQNDLIFDFFSGSATTAHSVMQLNSEDNGNRKYILVQLPEKTDEKSEAYKAGYKTIADIGQERIRRAGEKIKADNASKEGIENLDIGFKVFKLDSSNIKAWDSDFDNLEQNLLDAIDNIKEDRTNEDLLYEILLKYGLDLTLPIEEKTINDKQVFIIGYGALVVCLDDDITTDTVEAIAKLKEAYQSTIMRVVFKDQSFKNAVVKTNALQILKQFGVDEVESV